MRASVAPRPAHGSEDGFDGLLDRSFPTVDVEDQVRPARPRQERVENGRDVVARDVAAKRLEIDPNRSAAGRVGQATWSDDRPFAVASPYGGIGLGFSAQIDTEDCVPSGGFSTPMPLSIT